MALHALGIINGRDGSIDDLSTVPDVGAALRAWFQKITLFKVTKQFIDFEVVESRIPFTTSGVIQPLSGTSLEMKPEGQRAWDWLELHCENGLILTVDEVVEYRGRKYRIMNKKGYSAYGFTYYEMVNDYGKDLNP
jgi:hypothetical protein